MSRLAPRARSGGSRAAGAGIAVAAGLAGGLAGGCTLITDSFLTNDFSGDPFPVGVDTSSGAILVGLHADGETGDRTAVLDLLSPFTLIDPRDDSSPSLSYVDLTLLGKRSDGTLSLPRARFPETQLISLHPCEAPAGTACAVGSPANPQAFDAVIGADALAGDAVRLRLGDDQIFVLADIGGSDRGRTLSCDAVFGSPYRGGGTLVLSGTELPFGNRRITMSACLGQDPDPGPRPRLGQVVQRGADALFVVSTSIGISLIDESAFARYQAAVGDPQVLGTASDLVNLPSGPVTGHRATLNRMALVGASISNALSPCRQIYAHHLLADGILAQRDGEPNLTCNGATDQDCPCKDGSTFCAVPAIVELTPPAGIDVLVVPDSDPTLQALRTELRPDQAEVDGVLGTNALRSAEIDVDYPHDRLLARCAGPGCLARPQLTQRGDRCQINHCIYGATDDVGCPAAATPPD